MVLPTWYYNQAKDYISIMSNSEYYTTMELCEFTKIQRRAEYKLMMPKMPSTLQPAPTPILTTYPTDTTLLSAGIANCYLGVTKHKQHKTIKSYA